VPTIDWERLFGVRAAAVLGGIALALAGLLFFKYSIEHGLIPPWLRVVIGTVVGVGCISAAEMTLRRTYAGTANALAGAGIVVLYAAFWAASARYGLVPMGAGFVLMIAVTAAGCMLAARHASLEIALLGLAGGFATPLLLSTGADRPIGLFGYILLLDVAMMFLAQRRRWPALALLSLAGTVFYEASWIGLRMGPERLPLGLIILGVFAIVFVLAGRLVPPEDRASWRWPQTAAVAVPFAFAIYFAADADFGPHTFGRGAVGVAVARRRFPGARAGTVRAVIGRCGSEPRRGHDVGARAFRRRGRGRLGARAVVVRYRRCISCLRRGSRRSAPIATGPRPRRSWPPADSSCCRSTRARMRAASGPGSQRGSA
jgi:hypothetical protein